MELILKVEGFLKNSSDSKFNGSSFVTAFTLSEDLSFAMEARGYIQALKELDIV